jgi:acyl dehydratase
MAAIQLAESIQASVLAPSGKRSTSRISIDKANEFAGPRQCTRKLGHQQSRMGTALDAVPQPSPGKATENDDGLRDGKETCHLLCDGRRHVCAVMNASRHLGHILMKSSETVERGRAIFFSRATGQTDAVFLDEAFAVSSGYRGLLVPPTFLLAMELEHQDPRDLCSLLGFDPAKVLHAEQSFDYYLPVCVGDRLHFEARIADIYEKKDGELLFIVRQTSVEDDARQKVAQLRRVIVVKNR